MMKISCKLGLALLAVLLSAVVVQGLKCWHCENADSIEQCDREGKIVRCNPFQNACGSEIRLNGGWLLDEGIKVFKYCKQKSACGNNQHQNKKHDWKETQCSPKYPNSVCRCCCEGDGCNLGELTCLKGAKKTCPTISPPRFGSLFCSNNTSIASRCAFHCNEGYYLAGERTSTCRKNKKWSSPPPACHPLKCPNLSKPKGGSMKCNMYNLYQSVCSFSCDKGYRLVGAQKSTCGLDEENPKRGKWTTSGQTCERQSCAMVIKAPANGRVVCSDGKNVGSICDFYCDDGYDIVGGMYSKCVETDDGTFGWDYPTPNCERLECDALPTRPANGDMVCTDGKYVNSVCTFTCDDKYDVTGYADLTCVSDYVTYNDYMPRWNYEEPTCERRGCAKEVLAPENGRVVCDDGTNLGSRCDFHCNEGYYVDGGVYTQCVEGEDGAYDWDYPTPTCRREECLTDVKAPKNGRVVCSDGTNVGSKCDFYCDDGYYVDGGVYTQCVGGEGAYDWDYPTPTCKRSECPTSPAEPKNGEVKCSDMSFLGSVCEFSCKDNYALIGEKKSTCVAPDDYKPYWDKEFPECVLKECPYLPSAPENGGVVCDEGKSFGSICTFTCGDDYKMIGTMYIKCTRSDNSEEPEWDYDPPSCERKECSFAPEWPENGNMHCSDANFFGSVCKFSCHDHYDLVGARQTTCVESYEYGDLKWDKSAPECVLKKCAYTPRTPQNGTMTCSAGSSYGSVCIFYCDEGFELIGSMYSECTQPENDYYGKPVWDYKPPTCKRKECSKRPMVPEHGAMECTDKNYIDSVCTFTCDDHYIMYGLHYTTCSEMYAYGSPEWEYESPTCVLTQCAYLPIAPENGEVSCDDGQNYGSVCTFYCGNEYKMIGPMYIKCIEPEFYEKPMWDYDPPTCMQKQCKEAPLPPSNGRMKCTNERYIGSICKFACYDGYYLEGAEQISCVHNYGYDGLTWDQNVPVCIRKECPANPPMPKNGYVKCNDMKFLGSVCTFGCFDSYDLVGEERTTCVESYLYYNPDWDNKSPECVRKECPYVPDAPTNGKVSCSDEQFYGSICTFYCDEDYEMRGAMYIKCILPENDYHEVPKWDFAAPTCKKKVCKPPKAPENGFVRCTDEYSIGSECEYGCEDFHRRVGPLHTTCHESAYGGYMKWTITDPPVCEKITCPQLKDIEFANTQCSDDQNVNSECQFQCTEEGYELYTHYNHYPKPDYTITCKNNSMWSKKPPCCARSCPPYAMMDLIVLLDSSSSIGASNWPFMLSFVNNIFNLFIVQTDAMNFGVVRYNNKIDNETQINLNDCPDDVHMLKEEVSKLPYNGQGTWTGQAMTYALENMLLPENGNRPDVRDVVLVITDGRSQDDVIGPAKALRDAGVLTFALGITPNTGRLDLDQIYQIAGSQSNLFLAKYGFDNLTPEFAREISRNICGNPCTPNSQYYE